MRKICLIAILLVSACCGFAQLAETSRFEVGRWSKTQSCRFEPFAEQGGMMVYDTEKTDEDKNRLWNFVTLDTSLFEQRSDLIALPDKLKLFDSKSSAEWAVFIFMAEKVSRSDSIPLYVVTFHRSELKFSTFSDKLPEKTVLQSMALIEGNLMLSVNYKNGGGFMKHYDLDHHTRRVITPNISKDYILFQFEAFPVERMFVLAVREFEEKRYKATTFQVYSQDGFLLRSYRFENIKGAGLGRMCFAFDDQRQLMVYATLDRESKKKMTVEGMSEDFSKVAVGVVWIKFAAGGTMDKTYLFKNLPEIEQALTASDRLRVKEELLKMKQGKKKGKKQEKGEITFQFYTPRLVKFGDFQVFAAEAFQPVYHTETRMAIGFRGALPVYYTVFDGYDFFSEILLAFDQNGGLRWFNAVRFDNDLTETLFPHASEAVCHDELLVTSPCRQQLRYEVFDMDGSRLLDQETFSLDFYYGADTFLHEFNAGVFQWYDDRFLVHGCQAVENPQLRNTQRVVFYVQKIQYE